MILSEDFTYSRKYFVSDLYEKKNIFKSVNSLEFDSFNIFIEKFLKDPSWLDLNLSRLIVPVSKKEDISIIGQLSAKHLPKIFLYIKDLSVFDDLDTDISDMHIIVDDTLVKSFKDYVLSTTNSKLIDGLKKSIGFVRTKISVEDVGHITEKYTNSFVAFPFFSVIEAYWDFKSFQNVALKDLPAIIYDLKFIRKNILINHKDEYVCWDTIPNQEESFSRFTLELSKYAPYRSLVFTETGLKCDKYAESDVISYEDLNNLDYKKLNKLCGMFCVYYFGEYNLYNSYYQNYVDNGNYTQLPYLNQIVNSILEKGEI